ncbi:methionine--tRNA ligase [candidate division WWE3 bacterium CG_4_9_14_0_2_um_filter_35_11]|uniref:Methionine--tRNA ligase n=1 Tax=candidate division WWE3 bacterium CG_4_9_14_0_2_um_filter_35_11 TaxID=1975077 RepID=A0A2M8EML9_UNCKA|nr:MAG: methionine--tRNA ligase [candidate division WWE3 bacterium CG10_big_fil_rev_8_21_14_0_10_35_32]PJC23927.1 MAG: methionine--tRNA ligase [candidate division WWE3 bacterium CG_4_9_14_0_2_um_filter_35_11]
MDPITYDDFQKLDIKVGTILSVENVEGSVKLLKIMIDFGNETRQIISGIAKWYVASSLVGKQVPVLINLEPRKFLGQESQGMILMADNEDNPVQLHPSQVVNNGTTVR